MSDSTDTHDGERKHVTTIEADDPCAIPGDRTPDLCDCDSYDDQSLCIVAAPEDGPALYECEVCGFRGTMI